MGAQRRVEENSYMTNDYVTQLDKYFNEQAKSNKGLESCDGVLGRAKNALQKIKNNGLLYSQSIGPKESNFRASISTKRLEENNEKSNAELIGDAMNHWINFAKSISRIGNNGAKVFVQIDGGKAVFDFKIATEELLE